VVKAIIKCVPVLACILCACTVSASLDRLPDPPATKPHVLGVPAFSVCAPLQGPAHQAAIPFAARWIVGTRRLFLYEASEHIVPIHRPALTEAAADVSPPYRFSIFT
jgi:hypothetical protein